MTQHGIHTLIAAKEGARATVDDAQLAAYLRGCRTQTDTPLCLSFDAFVGVYNDIIDALHLQRGEEDHAACSA